MATFECSTLAAQRHLDSGTWQFGHQFGLLGDQCLVCISRSSLDRCALCNVAFYCGCNGQRTCRDSREKFCLAIRDARSEIEQELGLLRESYGGRKINEILEAHEDCHRMHTYLQARRREIDQLFRHPAKVAVETALELSLELLRNDVRDHANLRFVVPFMFMRLNRDQEAYDYLKYNIMAGEKAVTEGPWERQPNPKGLCYLNENVLEPLAHAAFTLDLKQKQLPQCVAMTLLKIKLLINLNSLSMVDIIGSKLPTEVLDMVEANLALDCLQRPRHSWEALRCDETAADIAAHIRQLMLIVAKQNFHYLPLLLRDDLDQYHWVSMLTSPDSELRALTDWPVGEGRWKNHSKAFVHKVLQISRDTWLETPGALRYLKQLSTELFSSDESVPMELV